MEFIVLPVTSEKYKDFLIKEVRRAEKRGMIDWTKVAFKKDNQTLSKYKSQFNIAH